MNSVQLELEKIIEELAHMEQHCEQCEKNAPTLNEEALYLGAKKAYGKSKEKCERLLDVVTGIYPESRSRDIQEQ